MKTILMGILLSVMWCVQIACAGMTLDAIYPYNLDKKDEHTVHGESTVPLYFNINSFDNATPLQAEIKVTLPAGFVAHENDKWQVASENGQVVATSHRVLHADFAQTFDLLYLQAEENVSKGEQYVRIEVKTGEGNLSKDIAFTYEPQSEQQEISKQASVGGKKKMDRSKFNWYIQSVILPVDSQGVKDDKSAEGVLYVRDTTLEGFRNRIAGDGATNWASVFNHPATHILLSMRNPQQDVRMLKFKAELIDKKTGENMPGLAAAGKVSDDAEAGWAGESGKTGETTALISLDGKKDQNFVIPLYVDYFSILEGDYSLRITVSGNGQEKIQEVPLIITKKHNVGLAAVGFAFACLIGALLCIGKLRHCVDVIGAKGAITVALFAALAFGGITLPTTLLGDLLHVFLGPFSGLFTGLLSGVLQYLLLVSLLMLFRAPGVLALMYFVKYMLAGLMFGHFTPVGVLSTAVNIAVLETVLYISGFYRKDKLTPQYMLFVCVLLGMGDAIVTFVNLEQLMFFYRLYYADWYLALYMLVNGLLYSSIGAWLGFKTGSKLQQVMGE